MLDKKISRRDFLKTIVFFFFGAISLYFIKLFKSKISNGNSILKYKEAKYYKSDDSLLG